MSTFSLTIGGSELKKTWSKFLRAIGRTVALYLDDLLLLGGGCCFVRAAWELGGRPAALVVAGGCLVTYAVVIATARNGGAGK